MISCDAGSDDARAYLDAEVVKAKARMAALRSKRKVEIEVTEKR